MEKTEYFELLKKYQVPTEQDNDRFLRLFANEHSWYEHLTDDRERLFIFLSHLHQIIIKIEPF